MSISGLWFLLYWSTCPFNNVTLSQLLWLYYCKHIFLQFLIVGDFWLILWDFLCRQWCPLYIGHISEQCFVDINLFKLHKQSQEVGVTIIPILWSRSLMYRRVYNLTKEVQLKGGKAASWAQRSHPKLTLLIRMALFCKTHICPRFMTMCMAWKLHGPDSSPLPWSMSLLCNFVGHSHSRQKVLLYPLILGSVR